MKRLTKYLYENEPGMDCTKCSRRKTGKCNSSADCVMFAAERLFAIEDILGDDYDLDRLRELVEADRDGRCVVMPVRGYTDKDGEQALSSAMNTCFYHNNPVTRYIADAVAEKLTREAAEASLKGENDA